MIVLDTLKLPERLPSSTHEVIVMLEEVHMVLEDIDTAPRTHEYISYRRISKAEEVRERIQCASIVIAPQAFIAAESLGDAPHPYACPDIYARFIGDSTDY